MGLGMTLELVGIVMAGIGGAGIMAILRAITRGRLPGWLTPVGAGGAMLAAVISLELGWYGRFSAEMPDTMVVAYTVETTAPFRPWTYLVPYTDKFVAVDSASLRRHEGQPNIRIADSYYFARWRPSNVIPVLADCENARRAPLRQDVAFNDDGTVRDAAWVSVAADDPLLSTICERI